MLYKDIVCPRCKGLKWFTVTNAIDDLTNEMHNKTCDVCKGQGYIYQPVSCGSCKHSYYYGLDCIVCKTRKTTVKADMACEVWEEAEQVKDRIEKEAKDSNGNR
jgi:DnaJ-class molecular chaperone